MRARSRHITLTLALGLLGLAPACVPSGSIGGTPANEEGELVESNAQDASGSESATQGATASSANDAAASSGSNDATVSAIGTGGASSTATSGSGFGGDAQAGTSGESGSGGKDTSSSTAGAGGTMTTSDGAGGQSSTTSGSGDTSTSSTSTTGSGTVDDSAAALCVETINSLRASLGLPALERWASAEECVDGEAESDATTGQPHGAFGSCNEFAQNECPGWPGPAEDMIGDCLDAMWAEGPGRDYSKHGHYINMTNTQYTQVACGFYTLPNGDVWAAQNFR